MLRPPLASEWLFWLLAAGTLSIGLLRANYPQRFRTLARMPFRGNQPNEFEDRQPKADIFSITLDVWGIVCIGLALTLINRGTLQFDDWAVLGRSLLFIGLFIAIQGFVYHLAGMVFDDKQTFQLAWMEKISLMRWSVLWITPLVWWMSFSASESNTLRFGAVILLILIYAWALFRSTASMWRHTELNKFHSILYLCTLEICPLMILIYGLGQ